MEIIITQSARDKIYKGYDPFVGFTPTLPYDIQGWASYSQAFEDSIRELQPKLIVEVGTWKGASAIHMAKTCKKYYDNFEIVCIDTFLASVEHWTTHNTNLPPAALQFGRPTIYETFLTNVYTEGLTKHITPFPIDSINGGLVLRELGIKPDLVYIDAGHEYQSVFMDLMLYKDIVRSGGHLLGDDWFHPPIRAAVGDALGTNVITKSHDKFLWVKP